MPVIPYPLDYQQASGGFALHVGQHIGAAGVDAKHVRRLADQIESHAGLTLTPGGQASDVLLTKDETGGFGAEGYALDITPDKVTLRAATDNGLFYAMQTLLQMIPPGTGAKQIPCGRIVDQPRFAWRGLHLDVARHFMPKAFVKKYIDAMAHHKLNVLHLHMVDDQGWRIEINSHPTLTEVGSRRKQTLIGHKNDEPKKYDGTPHGGFYRQDDIREIVAYAAERAVMVLPEIELPGHCLAALAAYPALSCTGGPFEVPGEWGIFEDVFCAGNDLTFSFLQDVLSEVIELFPGPFFHLGGDETPHTRWKDCAKCQTRMEREGLQDESELYSWFVGKAAAFLQKHGKKVVGWDEILEGDLPPGATVMSWRGVEGGVKAAEQGHQAIMCPGKHCYFDWYQADAAQEPLAIGGFLPLSKAYAYEPVPDQCDAQMAKHILGVQGCVWTEYMPTPEHVEYMAYPRVCALAEVAWTAADRKDWDDFMQRMRRHDQRLRGVWGLNSCPLNKSLTS